MDVLTVSEMEQADRLAIAGGQSGFALMLRAGQAVADAAMDMAEDGPILVVAGRGEPPKRSRSTRAAPFR